MAGRKEEEVHRQSCEPSANLIRAGGYLELQGEGRAAEGRRKRQVDNAKEVWSERAGVGGGEMTQPKAGSGAHAQNGAMEKEKSGWERRAMERPRP